MDKARIAVLSIALSAGAVAAYLVSREPETKVVEVQAGTKLNTTQVLVARQDLEVGRGLRREDVEWQEWPASSASNQFITRGRETIDSIVGSITRASFATGEPIRESKLVRANGSGYMAAIVAKGMRAISTEITPENGVGGFVLPNDRVDVVLTSAEKSPGGAERYLSRTLLQNVRVLAIDQTIEEKNGQKAVIGKIATLELDQQDGEKLALARRLGTISLMLRSLSDQTGSIDRSAQVGEPASTVNIVRYGRVSVN